MVGADAPTYPDFPTGLQGRLFPVSLKLEESPGGLGVYSPVRADVSVRPRHARRRTVCPLQSVLEELTTMLAKR